MLVPFRLGIFLPAPMLLDCLGQFPHEVIHACGGLLGALRIFLRRHPPLWRGDSQFIIRALDDHAPVRLAEPFEVKAIGRVLRRLRLSVNHVEPLSSSTTGSARPATQILPRTIPLTRLSTSPRTTLSWIRKAMPEYCTVHGLATTPVWINSPDLLGCLAGRRGRFRRRCLSSASGPRAWPRPGAG